MYKVICIFITLSIIHGIFSIKHELFTFNCWGIAIINVARKLILKIFIPPLLKMYCQNI